MPQASAVWSADPEQMWSFPASFMAEFFDNHGMYSLRDRPRWRTVSGGSRRYVEAIAAPWRDRVRLRAPVRRIERLPDRVRIEADGCESEDFDEVVIATHSDQALAMLADPSEAEREILAAIPYQRNEAVLHTDTALLPRRRGAWSSWNFHLADEPAGGTTVTYWMNNLQRLRAEREYLLTLNRGEEIDPDKVLRRFSYDHPVYTARGRPRPGPPRRDQRRRGAPTTAAPTGAGASTRTASSAPCAPASGIARSAGSRPGRHDGGAGGMTASAVYEGDDPPPALRADRALFPLPALPHVPRPRRAAGGARPLPALVGPPPRAGALPPRGLHGRPGAAAGRVRPRRRRGRDRRPPRPARSAC